MQIKKKIRCNECGKEVNEISGLWSVCDKCGGNFCNECYKEHKC